MITKNLLAECNIYWSSHIVQDV